MILKVLVSKNVKRISFARAMIYHKSISPTPPSSFSTLSVQQRMVSQELNQYFPQERVSSNVTDSVEPLSVRDVKSGSSKTSTTPIAAKVIDFPKLNQLDNYTLAQLKKIGRAFSIPVNLPQDILLENIKNLQKLPISQLPAHVLLKLMVNEINKIADDYCVPHRTTKYETLHVIREKDHGKSISIETFLAIMNRIQPIAGMQRILLGGVSPLPAGMKSFPLLNGKLHGSSLTSPLTNNNAYNYPSARNHNKLVDIEELNIIKAKHIPKVKAFQLFISQCQKEHSIESKSHHLPNAKNYLRKYQLEPTYTTHHNNNNYTPMLTNQYFQQSDSELFTLLNNELLLCYLMDYYHTTTTAATTNITTGMVQGQGQGQSVSSSSSRSFSSSSSSSSTSSAAVATVSTVAVPGEVQPSSSSSSSSSSDILLPTHFMKKIIINSLKHYSHDNTNTTNNTTNTSHNHNHTIGVVHLQRKRIRTNNTNTNTTTTTTPITNTTTVDTDPLSTPSTSSSLEMLPFTVVGDIHGSLHHINHIFSEVMGGYPSALNPYLFLGNVISFQPYTHTSSSTNSDSTIGNDSISINDIIGHENLSILLHLLHLQIACPDAITILQGKEEYSLLLYIQSILDIYTIQRHNTTNTTNTPHITTNNHKKTMFTPSFNVMLIPEEDIKLLRSIVKILSSLPVAAQLEDECFLVSSGIGKQSMTLTTEDMNYIMSLKGRSAVKMNLLNELLFSEPHFPLDENTDSTTNTTAVSNENDKKPKKSSKDKKPSQPLSSSPSSSSSSSSKKKNKKNDTTPTTTTITPPPMIYEMPTISHTTNTTTTNTNHIHSQFDATILRRFLRHQQMKYMICSNINISEGFYQYNAQCVVIDSAPHRVLPSKNKKEEKKMKKGVVLRFDDKQSMRYAVLPFPSLN